MNSNSLLLVTLALVACTSTPSKERAHDPATEPKPNSVPMVALIPMKESAVAGSGTVTQSALAIPAKPADAPAEAPTLDPREARVAALEKEYNDARDEFFEGYGQLKTPEERTAFQKDHALPRASVWAEKLAAIVAELPADAAALRAGVWIVTNGSGDPVAKAIDSLLEHHLASPGLAPACAVIGRKDTAANRSTLALLLEKSPAPEVRGRALLALANLDRNASNSLREAAVSTSEESAKITQRLPEDVRNQKPDDLERSAIERYARVRREFGGISDGKSTLGARADNAIFELENLSVGKQVPELQGADVDEVAFQLSDYKGKVVLLDFWGSW